MTPISKKGVYAWLEENHFYIRSDTALNSCLEGAYADYFGQEIYEGGLAKAAKVLLEVQSQHPLVDGNKRLGAVLFIAVLGEYGFEHTFSEDELVDFCLLVASGELRDHEEIRQRLATHSKDVTPSPAAHPFIEADTCGAWMPRAQTTCILNEGHSGHHRSVKH